MSFCRARGKKLYLYWNVKVWDEKKKAHVWRQRSKAISSDRGRFNSFKKKFDYTQESQTLGLVNDKAEWADLKASVLQERKGNTLEIYERALERFEKISHPHKIAEFTYAQAKAWRGAIDKWISPSNKTPLSNVTKDMDRRCLAAAWNEAKKLKYTETNPFEELEPFKGTKKKPRYLSREDLDKVMAEARKSSADGIYPICLILKYTGLRKSEIINLRWDSLDLERGLLYIREGEGWEPKDREENAIGIHPEILKELGGRQRLSEYVFPGRGGKRRDRFALGRLFNAIYSRAGVNASGVHILRHTFATHAPIPEKLKQKVLGHSDPRTTQRYVHVTPEDMDSMKRIKY